MNRHSSFCIFLFCCLLGAKSIALAQTSGPTSYAAPEYIRQPPAVPPHWNKGAGRSITLAEAIELTVRKNLGLAVERETVIQRDAARSSAIGSFEPTLRLSASHNPNLSPPSTAQDGRPGQIFLNTTDLWSLNLSETLPTGTILNVNFSNSRRESASGSAVLPLIYSSQLILQITQPILNGFSFNNDVQWQSVLFAEFGSAREREAARQLAIEKVKNTEDLYWGLVASWKIYQVKRQACELAENQVELVRRKIAAGTAPQGDLIKAQSDLASKQVTLLTVEAGIESAADLLRQQLNLPPDDWEPPLVPLDPPSFTPMLISFDAAWKRALASRPELRMDDIDRKSDNLNLEVARNNLLPQLNLRASVGTVGQDPQYSQTLEQVGSHAGWQWMVGADFAFAPLTIGARAGVRRAVSVLRQDGMQREQHLAQIRIDLRTARRDLETAEKRVYAAARSRELAEQSLDIEQRKFLSGLSNPFNVALAQAAVEQAHLDELTALINHENARSELLRAMGELLEARQLKFEVRPD